ncbi:hypothetical protein [Erwinia billingiae]|uniref:hypothetical protein n=1 Tax=Erwinia billingiae TaxID=182337 RepID=UPI0012FEBF22|nr:hypothetical protein [Erwinia billingiae]
MGTPRFTAEYKEEAVRQITERGYSVGESSPYDGDPASPSTQALPTHKLALSGRRPPISHRKGC